MKTKLTAQKIKKVKAAAEGHKGEKPTSENEVW